MNIKNFFGFASVFFIGCLVLLFKMESHNLWLDEAYTLWQSSKSLSDLLRTIFQQDPHPPLYYMIMKVWGSFFGASINSGLYLSAIFSFLSVCAGGYLSWLVFGNYNSILMMFCLVFTSPFYIMFSRMIRYYSFVSFLVLVCLICFIKYLNSGKKLWWFFLLMIHIVMIYSDYPAVTVFFGELCSVVLFRKYRNKILGLGLIFLLAIVAFYPWVSHLFFNINNLSMSPNRALLSGRFAGFILRGLFCGYDFIVGECIYPWKFYVTIPLIVTFFYIIKNLYTHKKSLFTENKASQVLFFTVFISFVAVIFMSSFFMLKQSFVYTPSRVMFCFIPLMIFIAHGMSCMGRKGYGLLAVILLCNSVSLYSYYYKQQFINPIYAVDWNKAIEDVKANLKGDEILISDESEVLRYYVKNELPNSRFFYDEYQLKYYLAETGFNKDKLRYVIFKTQRDSTGSGMFSQAFIDQLIAQSQVISCKEYTPLSEVYVKLKKYLGAEGYKYKMKVITAIGERQPILVLLL